MTLEHRSAAPASITYEEFVMAVISGQAEGAIAEVSPAAMSIAATIAERIALYGGAALIVDYGHADHRTGETLQGIHGHEMHSFLKKKILPGPWKNSTISKHKK